MRQNEDKLDPLGRALSTLAEDRSRAWLAIDALADKQAKIDDALTLLTESQIRTQEQFREADRRIDKLVIAIGEFIRLRDGR